MSAITGPGAGALGAGTYPTVSARPAAAVDVPLTRTRPLLPPPSPRRATAVLEARSVAALIEVGTHFGLLIARSASYDGRDLRLEAVRHLRLPRGLARLRQTLIGGPTPTPRRLDEVCLRRKRKLWVARFQHSRNRPRLLARPNELWFPVVSLTPDEHRALARALADDLRRWADRFWREYGF